MRITGVKDKINFTAGKVEVFSDFDGTYCPARHSSLHDVNSDGFMPEYCDRIDKFLKSTEGDLHFNITTGRTYGEYECISWLLRMRNFRLPFPETLITKDGSDRLIRNGSDSDFYERGVFPFSYDRRFKEKEEHIKSMTNWDGAGIHDELKRLVGKYKIRLVEADSQNSVFDYGDRSLFSEGKLNPEDWRNLPSRDGHILEHQTPVAEYVLGSRNDGNLKFYLVFPPDYGYCPERNWIYDNFMDDLRAYMSSKNIHYNMEWEGPEQYNKFRISCSITPQFENGPLTKLYDTKEAVKKALKNDDVVITAGDGSNDFDMLNPLRYLDKDFLTECEKNSKNKTFYQKDMQGKLEDLQKIYNGDNSTYIKALRQELTQNGFLRKLEELPLYSIVIKKEHSKLQPLIDTFGRIGKVIEVETGRIDDGIKKAIKNYAEKNKIFRDAMSSGFQSLISGAKKKSAEQQKNSKKSSPKIGIKIAAGIIFAGLLGYAGYKYIKDRKNGSRTNINSTNTKPAV